jgi:hypothetical protein
MKSTTVCATLMMIVLGAGIVSAAHADRDHREGDFRRSPGHRPGWVRPPPHTVYDSRFHPHHYYPAPGFIVNVLPPGYTTLWIGATPYYYANNVYYTSAADG